MAESRYACQTRVRKEADVRRLEVRKMRDDETRAISSDWKEGFAKLKADNDQRQAAVKKFFIEQMTEIDNWLMGALADCSR